MKVFHELWWWVTVFCLVVTSLVLRHDGKDIQADIHTVGGLIVASMYMLRGELK